MKKVLIAVTIAAALVILIGSGCFYAVYALAGTRIGGRQIKGSGKFTTYTVDVPAFERLAARNGAQVTVTPGSGPVTVKTDDNLAEFVEVKVERGVLRIGFDSSHNSYDKATLEVTVPAGPGLCGLRASGASTIAAGFVLTAPDIELKATGASRITAQIGGGDCEIDVSGASKALISGTVNRCDAEASGASHLDMNIVAATCKVESSGASKAVVAGSAETAELRASGASSCDASQFVTAVCDAHASGASKVSVNCTRKLNAGASGASKVVYTGGSTDNVIESSGASSVSHR